MPDPDALEGAARVLNGEFEPRPLGTRLVLSGDESCSLGYRPPGIAVETLPSRWHPIRRRRARPLPVLPVPELPVHSWRAPTVWADRWTDDLDETEQAKPGIAFPMITFAEIWRCPCGAAEERRTRALL